MKKELKDKHFLKKPEYPGGMKSMQAFLAKNKIYPSDALENKIEGTVTVRYTIDFKGNVIQTKVLAGIGFGCDEEAERIVSLLKFNVPKSRKLKVQYQKTVHIHFRLPEEKPQDSTTISYTFQPRKEKTQDEASKKSYQIHIKW